MHNTNGNSKVAFLLATVIDNKIIMTNISFLAFWAPYWYNNTSVYSYKIQPSLVLCFSYFPSLGRLH